MLHGNIHREFGEFCIHISLCQGNGSVVNTCKMVPKDEMGIMLSRYSVSYLGHTMHVFDGRDGVNAS